MRCLAEPGRTPCRTRAFRRAEPERPSPAGRARLRQGEAGSQPHARPGLAGRHGGRSSSAPACHNERRAISLQEKVASRPLWAGGHLCLPRSGRRGLVLKNPDELRLPRLAVPDKDVTAGSHLRVDELVQGDRAVGYIGL